MALSGRPSPLAIIFISRHPGHLTLCGRTNAHTVYNTYVLKTCNRTNQQINCYNTAYAVVKMLLYGDLWINKYSYSYSYSYFLSLLILISKYTRPSRHLKPTLSVCRDF
jgi:hypothetical protein